MNNKTEEMRDMINHAGDCGFMDGMKADSLVIRADKLLSSLPPSGPVCCTACGHTESSHMKGACIISTCRCKEYIVETLPPSGAASEQILDRLKRDESERYPKFVERVSRFEDMSPEGKITLYRQQDGDVIIEIITDEFERACVEFCTPMTGGGQSSHTHMALCQLMVAMEKDEQERKQHRESGGIA